MSIPRGVSHRLQESCAEHIGDRDIVNCQPGNKNADVRSD